MGYDLSSVDSAAVKSLINSGVELFPNSLFRQAVEKSDLDMIQFLLTHNTMPIEPVTRDNTLLHIACKQNYSYKRQKNDEAIVRLLLTYPFDINAKDRDGNTPLHLVYCETIAQLLLDAGANRTILNNKGKTAEDLCREKSEDMHSDYAYKYHAIVELFETYDIPDVKGALDE